MIYSDFLLAVIASVISAEISETIKNYKSKLAKLKISIEFNFNIKFQLK
jgi:hypothetical protein